ncbi:16S rRNA (guanine(966)-N(2))-methyltransferase RsmD, partial [Vibrio anguillarum]|nr:16S rRNA (guanine(966)-N(2))-methyltransferase RsmD [Vibrio anguillarum]
SRQAQAVTLIELNPTAFKQLEHNIAALNATNLRAINSDALAFLKQQGTPHHLVFIDPPFRQGLLSEAVSLLEQNGWLADEALIYIETEKELALEGIPANW